MKQLAFLILMASTLAASEMDILNNDSLIIARGGGRGGGGGGRGAGAAARGGTPSMSRPAQSVPRGDRAGGGAQRVQQYVRQENASPKRAEVRPQAQSNLSDRAQARPQSNFADIHRSNADMAANTRQAIKQNRPQSSQFFDNNFLNNRNYRPQYDLGRAAVISRAYWNDVNDWVGGGWNYPLYYGDSAYYGGYAQPTVVTNYQEYQPVQTAPTTQQPSYAKQEAAAPSSEWMLLGDFIVANSAKEAPYSNIFLQLALKKSGEIGGTYYNATSDQARQLVGMVDKEKQEAVFLLSDKADSPLVTAGLFNLTEDVAPILVHFTDGTQQNWVMVRLEK